ncbi:type II toxin-antitoxin system HipA family toxin [Xanthomonas perforans]|uniref:type II toxin-antitoxin system HipA family toxin n=1 Tax=Xanthomonas axonopodis TaxID=53413 RepID=UPI003557F892
MTSSDRRAYVYLQLPQSMEVVTAGFYELDFPQGLPSGSFVYNPSYLDRRDAVPLEPYELPLKPQRATTVKLKGIFGALRDASPDAWGRRIIEKHTGRSDLTEVDFLLNSPEDRAGALSFGRNRNPPSPVHKFNQIVRLDELLAAAESFMRDDGKAKAVMSAQMFDLLQPGTSMGGARPKNVVEDSEGLWLAKFPDPEDKWNNARVEGAMLTLAKACDLHVARHRIETVAGKDVLLVQRFDREKTGDGYIRHRMVSGLTALGAEDSHGDRGKWSYMRLADELRRRSARPAKDLEELYRRMVFNALISNIDDHPRNHALIAPTKDWELSLAYDLTPNPLVSLEKRDLAMACGIYNRYANRANLLSQHAQFKLSLDSARTIIDQMQQVVETQWRTMLLRQGVTQSDCEKLATAFNYPGFELDPEQVLESY